MKRVHLAIAASCIAFAAIGTIAVWQSHPAVAQEAFAGSWDVVDVQPAPWVDANSANKPYVNEEVARGRITFMADSVQGPALLNCDRAKYEIAKVPPEYLFQGGLSDPTRQAKELGFKGGEIVQMSMSCISGDADIGMDFDLLDEDVAVFALDNMVYRMRRVQP
ncbi:hypothetical protein [Dongia sp.]|uniref:hypothetical protein n=1 Tax=Dongia sp. TaxID=1977262 RepID=UPI0035B13DE5